MIMLLQEAYNDVSFLHYVANIIETSMITEPSVPPVDVGDDGNITNPPIPEPDGELN